MRFHRSLLTGAVLLLSTAAVAQEAIPKVEVGVEYSYLRFNPALPQSHNRSYSGGGGDVDFNIGRFFAIKAEFMGYGSTTWSVTNTAPIVTPKGVIPIGNFNTQANMFTYQFGPVIKLRTTRVTYFGEVLFGGSNTNGYANLSRAFAVGGGTIAASDTQHPFTMVTGGGLDINFARHFAFRPIEIDYMLTRYTNPFTSTNNQNNFRYIAGVVFKL